MPDGAPPARAPWTTHTGDQLLLFLNGTETFLVSPPPTIAASVGVSVAAAAGARSCRDRPRGLAAPVSGRNRPSWTDAWERRSERPRRDGP
ncbi:hypothetical protein ABT218_18320 [Streptomyces sp. NPDC001455]|uniref:hypothetical protein n=1 Tax=Streptomyces sp. NPDC001455 TaxID=3154518 RepID=UPI003326BCA1